MKRKHRLQQNRADRRLRYAGLKAEFLLAGGHKDWLVPFNHNWKEKLNQQIASVESGNLHFTQPRYSYGNVINQGIQPTPQWNGLAISGLWTDEAT